MTPLPAFTAIGTIYDVVGDLLAGELKQRALLGATVTFTNNLTDTDFVVWDDKLNRIAKRELATVTSDGTIQRKRLPVVLLANDAGLNVDGIQWEVSVVTREGVKFTSFWFDAPADGETVDLAGVARVPGVTPSPTFHAAWSEITGKPVVIAAGADAAAARAAIGIAGAGGDWEQFANFAAFPGTGNTALEYLAIDTNKLYRWSGSAYVLAAQLVAAADLTDSGTAGRAVVQSETQAAARAAIDAAQLLSVSTAVLTASTAPTKAQITRYDATGGALTPTLPALSGLAAGDLYGVQKYQGDASVNTVTLTAAGSDVFDSGGTSLVLRVPAELRILQVVTVSAVKQWKVVGGNTPLASLDTRYAGTVATGVRGGKTTVLRRRDVTRGDRLSPWYGQITATVASGFASTISSAQSYTMSATPTWCTPVNGATFTSNPLSSASFMLNWRSPNGGSVAATTYPWPTATGIEFELDTASTQAFELYFRCASPSATTFFYELWIDGQRVWDLPQTTSVTANSSTLIKFSGLPTGVHRYRVVLNNCSIYTLFTPQYTIPAKPPARGPRIFFLGDSLMSVGANSGTSGMHTGIESGAWPWRFAEMVGCDDLWQGGIGSTGFIATAGGRTVTDGAMTSGSNILTSATATFVTGDAGAPPANACQVVGAGPGGSVLSALITSRTDATHVVLDTNASTTVSNAWTRIGGSASNFVIRAITDVVPAAPDIVIMGGWHNDASSGATLIADAYNRAITTIQTALPNTMIIPFGAWDSVGTAGSTYTTIDAAVLAVCTAHGVPYIETGNNGNVYDGAGNIVATQGKWIDTNTKNIYTCSDNTHETDAGMTYIAHRMCQAVYALLPA